MASKSVYQEYDTDALNHFGLASDPIYGILAGSNMESVLVTQDNTTYGKIEDILKSSKETDTSFRNKKKAFVMPGADVSLDKIKAALKEHKITVTNDYTKADLIITNKNIATKCNHGENIPTTKMLIKLLNYELVKDGALQNRSFVDDLIDEYKGNVILSEKITEHTQYYYYTTVDSLYDNWIITGLALNIAYLIDTGVAGTVDCETILHASSSQMDLTEELLSQLTAMLNGSKDEKEMAASIIPNLNPFKNYHLLWQFAQKNSSLTYKFNRNKNLQYWMDQVDFPSLYYRSAQEMILWLEENELLDGIYFKYLEPLVRKEISISNRDLYVFKVSVKKEYQKYLK
ncbi:MAG: hypothetical protein K0U52_05685 [Gammaproteobacteria bacterium]|nr:hypothetical protein [Gammaproteobacteria bacterium]